MRRVLEAVGLVVVMAMLVAACGGDQHCRSACQKPAWVDNPPVLSAAGAGKGINAGMARELCADKGRHALAREINVQVAGLAEQSWQQVIGANDENTGHQYAEGITRSLHKMFLSGSRAAHYWEDCCDGTYYCLVTIEKEGLLKAANQAGQQAAKKLLKGAEAKHKELNTKFGELLEKEFE